MNILGALKAAVGAAVAFASTWSQTGTLDYKALIAAVVGAVLVYYVPNKPAGPVEPGAE